jgi:PAS domain S-box-containing protein
MMQKSLLLLIAITGIAQVTSSKNQFAEQIGKLSSDEFNTQIHNASFPLFDVSLIAAGIIILISVFRLVNKKGISAKFALQFGTKKFKKRTFIVVVSFVLLVVLMGVLSISFIKSKIVNREQLALEQTVESTKQKIDFWVQKRNSEILELVQSADFQEYLDESKNSDSAVLPKSLGFDYCFINTKSEVKSPSSSEIIESSALSEKCRSEITKLFSGKQLYLNNIDKSIEVFFAKTGDSKGLLYEGIPVKLNDEIVGVVLCEVFNEIEMSELLRFSRVGESGESYLINDKGRMITKSRFEKELAELNYFEENADGELIISIKVPNGNVTESNNVIRSGKEELSFMAKNLLKKTSGSNIDGYLDYRGVEVQGAWTWLDKYGLGLATEIDKSESLSVFYFIRKSAFYVLLMVIIIIVSSVLFAISLGEKANEVLIKAKDDLEHQVQERTAELRIQTSALQAAANAIFITDPDGKMIWLNQATTDLTGFTEKDCIGQNPRIFKSNQHSREFYENLWDTIKSGKVWKGELVNKRKNKEIYYEEMTITPVKDERGESTNFVAVKNDVTERKKNEKELINERKRFAQLLDSTPDAIVIINSEGIIEVVNNQLLSILGYKREEVIGQTIEIFLPADLKNKHIGHRGNFFNNPSHRNMGGRSELLALRKNGEKFPVEISLNPIKIEEEILVAAAIRDITERKALESKIKQSELQFRCIAQTAQDAIISANSMGIIESWNLSAEMIFGYSSEEAIGKDLSIIVPEKYKSMHKEGMERVKSGGEKHAIGKTVELVGQHKSGRTFPVDLSLSNWDGPDGMAFSGIIRDISERKKIQKALEEANERMSGELNVAKDIQMSMLPLSSNIIYHLTT